MMLHLDIFFFNLQVFRLYVIYMFRLYCVSRLHVFMALSVNVCVSNRYVCIVILWVFFYSYLFVCLNLVCLFLLHFILLF